MLLLGSPAFAAEGDNANVDGDLYIPFNTNGILGPAPSGYGQKGSSITMNVSDGPTSGSVKFYMSFQLYDADVPAIGTFNPANTYVLVTVEDIDIITDTGDVDLQESISVELIVDGPVDPANPGAYTPPAKSPLAQITPANYQALQNIAEGGSPIVNTNNAIIAYKLYFGGVNAAFVEQPGGPAIADILANAAADREFTLLVTLSSTLTPTVDGADFSNSSKAFILDDMGGNSDRTFTSDPTVPKIVGWREPHTPY